YAADPLSAKQMAGELAQGLTARRPGKDVTPEQLRRRSWWRGPEMFLLVDDYDLVVSGPTTENPLGALMDFLPQGRELGLHVVLARRTGGAGRSLFEHFIARVRDVGSPGILLSGDRDEGPLLGGLRAEHLPPGRGRVVRRGEAAQLVQLAQLASSSY
ncbi:MAG: type VII secretion protein EccC, partial [Thermocrispum sp.]